MNKNIAWRIASLSLTLWFVLTAMPAIIIAQKAEFIKKTYSFKVVGNDTITAIVFRHNDTKLRPVVVWIHGGALIMGDNVDVPGDIKNLCEAEGYVLVSLNYRLVPEVTAPAIIEDIQDAFRWIRQEGPALFQCNKNKIVVTGGSAGGYLTMMTGICVDPPPTALVAYWGYGNLLGDWYVKPSEFYRSQKLLSEKDIYENGKLKDRRNFYLYLRQNGQWTKIATGFDPKTEADKITPFCPVRHITPQYPPILMIHGTADTDVPYEESAVMASELARHKVPHELITVPGAGHGLSGGDKTLVADAKNKALEFIKQQMK